MFRQLISHVFDPSLSKLKKQHRSWILMGLSWLVGMTQTPMLASLLKTLGDITVKIRNVTLSVLCYALPMNLVYFCWTYSLIYIPLIAQLRSNNLKTRVIGCPKTIDGDLKCKEVPTSFGFDTACKVSSQSFTMLYNYTPYIYCSLINEVCGLAALTFI